VRVLKSLARILLLGKFDHLGRGVARLQSLCSGERTPT
jgi:hypothetical protein